MEVILLEKIGKLGDFGAEVNVKSGYARNFLVPKGKALRATAKNREYFAEKRAELEAELAKQKKKAEGIVGAIEGTKLVLIRPASEDGRLYGSITSKELAKEISEKTGQKIEKKAVSLERPIKNVGVYEIAITPIAEVSTTVLINIALTENEAVEAEKEYFAEPVDTDAEEYFNESPSVDEETETQE